MVKINIISGFLGAGKTTLIKKLLQGRIKGEKIILLENEYGDVGVDGSFMKDTGVIVDELNSGCICCTLVGDFQKAVDELIEKYNPDRLIIEPSGVGKLSEIVTAVEQCRERHADMEIAGCATVVDAAKCRMHMKNFGEFFLDQVKTADTVIFSRTQMISADKTEKSRALIEEAHPGVRVITTPWDDLEADVMLEVVESGRPIELHVEHHHHHHDDECRCHDHEHEHHHHHEEGECCCHDHEHEHHHHHHEEGECCCHDHEHEHHHRHEEGECCCHDHDHEHHHHHHEEGECCCHDHEHEHHHHHHDHGYGDGCTCGCHGHGHHHHHADEVFISVGWETAKRYEQADIAAKLEAVADEAAYGQVLRAKGILQDASGSWFQFDYVPGESQFRPGSADYTGRICVIGAKINEKALKELFNA